MVSIKGQIISGKFGELCIRQKSDQNLELGELLIADTVNGKTLLQVYDILYGSQISQQNLELISGMKLEQGSDLELYDPELRNYKLGMLKPLLFIDDKDAMMPKELPNFFSPVREVLKEDIGFLTRPKAPLKFGTLRSGSKTVDVDVLLDGEKVLSHHVLIAGTTGRGKSVLMSNLLWDTVDKDYAGVLVLDPHDEYYGRNKLGLKDHDLKDKVSYYTPNNPPPGSRTLKINLELIKPHHLSGVMNFSEAQNQTINQYYKRYKEKWIEFLLKEVVLDQDQYTKEGISPITITVLKRKLQSLLNIEIKDDEISCSGIIDIQSGQTTISDITAELEQGKTVIIDTSSCSGQVELLVGSLISNEIFNRYRLYKMNGALRDKPIISILLEEAPRVLGKEVLEKGSNIFSTIAREGRKFKVGLIAITQLPSLIPRQILANMNTKIILGIEMAPERQAIIDSAAQDLSTDGRNIASLDMGEAIITSNFAKFAIPVKVPFFDNVVKSKKLKFKQDFTGVGE